MSTFIVPNTRLLRRHLFATLATLAMLTASMEGSALAQQDEPTIDDGNIAITVRENATLGAGFGHLQTDRVDVTVTLRRPEGMELITDPPALSRVEDNSGRMIWKRGEFTTQEHVFLTEGHGQVPLPDHAVRFYGKLRPSQPEGEGGVPEFRTSVADVDIDADTLGRREGDAWPPTRCGNEDALEAVDFGGLVLPSDLWEGAFPDTVTKDQVANAKDLVFFLRTAWASTNPKAEPSDIGEWRFTWPDGIAIYARRPDGTIRMVPRDEWYPVRSTAPTPSATFHILTNAEFTDVGYITVKYRWHGSLRHGSATDETAVNAPYGAQDWIRVAPETPISVRFIRQDNSPFPFDEPNENDACHMVSKRKTDEMFSLDIVGFSGMPEGHPDDDTFRVEIQGLDSGLEHLPQVRLVVMREGRRIYNRLFDTVEGTGDNGGVYRTNRLVRLVATDADWAYGDWQTPRVKLGDTVYAAVAPDYTARVHLNVGRTPSETGNKAIRTVDVRYVGVDYAHVGNPEAATLWLSDTWAQAGIRFKQLPDPDGLTTVTPVRNILTVERDTFTESGSVSVTIASPDANTTVNVDVAAQDDPATIASALAEAIDAHESFTAASYRHELHFHGALVLVNKGNNVALAVSENDVASEVNVQAPLLDFDIEDNLSCVEVAALSLNFRDDLDHTVDIFIVGDAALLGVAWGLAGTKEHSETLPALVNSIFVHTRGVTPLLDFCAEFPPPMDHAYLLPHEMAHIVLNYGHVFDDDTNMLAVGGSEMDAVDAAKRLTPAQHDRARAESAHLLKSE